MRNLAYFLGRPQKRDWLSGFILLLRFLLFSSIFFPLSDHYAAHMGRQRALLHENPSSRFQPIECLVSSNRHPRGMSISNCLRKRWAGGMWEGDPPRSARGIRTSRSNHACLVLQATADQRTWDEGKGGGGKSLGFLMCTTIREIGVHM